MASKASNRTEAEESNLITDDQMDSLFSSLMEEEEQKQIMQHQQEQLLR